jgi:hypothetical protein
VVADSVPCVTGTHMTSCTHGNKRWGFANAVVTEFSVSLSPPGFWNQFHRGQEAVHRPAPWLCLLSPDG